MNSHPHLPRFAALLLGLCITSARAEDKPKPAPANPAEAAKNAPAKNPADKAADRSRTAHHHQEGEK
jgi:hypothetical protein